MALTGQLSDMSLAELIEFFCNQRKTGRLKVDYHRGHGVFFIKEGSLVDAKVGQLSGAEAVYFALTLPNAAFDFSPEVLPKRHTINEAWTQVVLEGLRRLDEGISPTESDAFGGWSPSEADMAVFMDQVERLSESASKGEEKSSGGESPSGMFEGVGVEAGSKKKWVMAAAAAACVVLAVAVVAIPLMRGSSNKPAARAASQTAAAPETEARPNLSGDEGTESAAAPETSAQEVEAAPDVAAQDAQREARERKLREQRERERRAEEQARKAEGAGGAAAPGAAAASGPKSVRISVTYDEAGRVTAASVAGTSPGAEAFAGNALRAARGKRFPAGKSGSSIITIPVN